MAVFAAGGIRIVDTIGAGTLIAEERMRVRTREVLVHFSDEMESYAQDNAPWDDRTGEARDGLQTTVEDNGDEFELILYNESEHGIWLEIAMQQRFQIIMPTIEHFEPLILEALAVALP